MQENSQFSWIPIQTEAAVKLLTFENNRTALITLLREMADAGLKPVSLRDQTMDGEWKELKDIDPFTFLASFNRGLTNQNRIDLWAYLKKAWNLASDIPTDFHGIPVVNNQKAWFIGFEKDRSLQDINTLWEFAVAAFSNPSRVTDELFQKALNVKQTAKAKLTMGLFWICPDRYIALDAKNAPKLQEAGISTEIRNWRDYINLLTQFKTKTVSSIASFSHGAHLEAVRFRVSENQIHSLMQRFKNFMPDFENFENPGSKFTDNELKYKQNALEEFQQSSESIEKNLELGYFQSAYDQLEAIISRTNIVDWRAWGKVFGNPVREAESLALLQAIKQCSSIEYTGPETLKPIFATTQEYGIKLEWSLLSTLLWLFNPKEYFPIKISFFRKLAEKLGHKLKQEAPSDKSLDEAIELGRSFYRALAPWHPKNWVDVQSFMWVVETWIPEEAKQIIPQEAHIWIVAPGEDARLWNRSFDNSEISIGWDYLGNLHDYTSKGEIEQRITEIEERKKRPTNNALACWQFANEIRVGDWLIAKQGRYRLLGYGAVKSDCLYDAERGEHLNYRKVDWYKQGEWRINDTTLVPKTLTNVTSYSGLLTEILAPLDLVRSVSDLPVEELTNAVEETPSDFGNKNEKSFWWLNANPKIWNFNDIKIGQKQTYTTHNENGNPRRIQKWFQAARTGDLLVAYSTSPDKEVVGFGKITKASHQGVDGESIEFEKTRTLVQPIPLETIKAIPELAKSEPLKGNQGSLFQLSEEEFHTIQGLADEDDELITSRKVVPYTKKDALDKLFIDEKNFDRLTKLLARKKNLILQGPPGVGKSYLAKRLAYAMIGEKNEDQVTLIQFHQSYAYEDFIQGYRPNSDGGFSKQNGVFYDFCRKARSNLGKTYFFIIDEINRGNLSRIFGELMLLLEADKRKPEFAMPLTYSPDVEFYVPENVHVIGMMNTADRSLAMVDYALRRRFAFVNLEPEFESPKFSKELEAKGVPIKLIERIRLRIQELNSQIAEDSRDLGAGYRIGHSFFCPSDPVTDSESWYQQVVDSEIRPLLEEYWADDGKGKADQQIRKLQSE